jgi:hypothetical protein
MSAGKEAMNVHLVGSIGLDNVEEAAMGRNVYLVGSVPMADASEVLETVGAALGPRTIPELLRIHAAVADMD